MSRLALASLVRHASSKNTGLNAELRNVVDNVAHIQATAPPRKPIDWKPFVPNKRIVPSNLSYNSLVPSPPSFYRKRTTPTSREARPTDPFYQLDLDPRDFCMNAPLLYEYVSEMGKIHPRNTTRLTAKCQRLLGKAIRRAKQIGIMALHSRPQKQPKFL